MNKKQKRIKFLDPDEEYDKYRYNTDKYYKKLWDDKVLEENEIYFKYPTNKFYLACFDVLKDEIYFQEYFTDEIIHKNCLLNRHYVKYQNRINVLHRYWLKIEELTGFNKSAYISEKAKSYFKRPISSNFIYPETKGLFNNYDCHPLPCVMQSYGEFEISIKVHLNCFDIENDEVNKNNTENENDNSKGPSNNIFLKTFDEFEFTYKIPLLYVVDTIIHDTIDELKIFLLTKMKEKRKEMEEEEEENNEYMEEEYKNEIYTNTNRNNKRLVSISPNKKLSKSNGSMISKDYLRYKNKLNKLEEGQKNNEYQFVLKLSKFEEYLFGDYSIGSYECIRNYIRQYMKIPLVLIKRPKFEIKPRISSFPPIIMVEANKNYSYFTLLDKYLENYPDKCAIFRFGESEKTNENEDREEKLTKYCESGECDCPFELTIVGIYNFKLMFEWLNDENYNKNEMMLGYFNEFQNKEDYESSLLKNKVQKFFGCTQKNSSGLTMSQTHFHRSGNIESGKVSNDNINNNMNSEESKKKSKQERKNQEQDRKKELKEKRNTINLIRKSTKNETELQNKLNFLRLNKAGADSQNNLFKYIFNSSSYPEDTERKINKLQTNPFYPFLHQKHLNYKHIKFSPTFITIKVELLYGSYDIESYYSKNYIINDNIDIMEKIYFNPDKLIISHLPRETRLGITVFIVNKECTSKTEIGSGQLPLFNERGEFISDEIKINLWPLFKINPRINCCEKFLMKSQTIKSKHSISRSYLRDAMNEIKKKRIKYGPNTNILKSTTTEFRRSRKITKSQHKRNLNDSLKSSKNKEKSENENVTKNGYDNENEENNENSEDESEKLIPPVPSFSTELYNSNDFCYIILKFPKYARKMIHTQKSPISYKNFLNIKGFKTEENGKEITRNPFKELFMVNEFNKVIEEFKETLIDDDFELINKKKLMNKNSNEPEGINNHENEPFLEVNINDVLEKLKDLNKLITLDPLTPINPEDRKTILLCRDFISTDPKGIDVFLRSINWFNPLEQFIAHLYLKRWAKLEPEDAIGLLDSRFPDTHVRELAIKTLSQTTDDIIELYMLELCQCLFYENYYISPLGDFIIEQSLKNQKLIGNKFYWCSKVASENFLFKDRIIILLTQLFMMSGPSFIDNITNKININAEFKNLSRTAKKFYPKEGSAKVNERVKNLIKERFNNGICNFELPIHPSYCVSGFEFTKLRVFSSKMVPIALNLYSSDGETFRVIFKIGDDLRQDSMILQIFKIMDKIWLENDLDLKLSIYNVCPLELKCGFMEFVEGTPLEEVQKKENDLGGALDKELLYKYLNNLSNEISKSKDGLPLDKELDNFIRSLAGYCVATGVMGIADRHPANVMIKKNGIFFHIDFGHIFGNFKKKFGFKRERSLFLLTPDMAYVYMKSNNKKIFINYCTNAFNILRRNAQRLLNITITMSSSNMPEFSTMSDVLYFRDMLKLELSNEEEASDYFIRMIKETINDKYRIIDNLIHNCVHP